MANEQNQTPPGATGPAGAGPNDQTPSGGAGPQDKKPDAAPGATGPAGAVPNDQTPPAGRQQRGPKPARAADPEQDLLRAADIDDEADLEKEKSDPDFPFRARNALKNGRFYCEAIKTVLARGEAQYPPMRFWQTKAEALEGEERGDLKILIQV